MIQTGENQELSDPLLSNEIIHAENILLKTELFLDKDDPDGLYSIYGFAYIKSGAKFHH